jgi:hypothetical protein
LGDYIVIGEDEPAGRGVVNDAVSAPPLHNAANDADKNRTSLKVFMEVRRRTARSSVGSGAGTNMKFGSI